MTWFDALLLSGETIELYIGSFQITATGDLAVGGIGWKPDAVSFLGADTSPSGGFYDTYTGNLHGVDGQEREPVALATGSQYTATGPARYRARQFIDNGGIRSGTPWNGSLNDPIPSFTFMFVSMDTGGFTINNTLTDGSTLFADGPGTYPTVYYIAFRIRPGFTGGIVVGTAVQPASTGTQTIGGFPFTLTRSMPPRRGRLTTASTPTSRASASASPTTRRRSPSGGAYLPLRRSR